MTRELQLQRELQIQEAAFNCGYVTGYSTFAAYMKGAKWADSSPNWHKFSDEKPPLEQRILVYTTKGRIAETVWRQPMLVSGEPHGEPTFEDNRYNKHNVIAWMEKPEPPKFD